MFEITVGDVLCNELVSEMSVDVRRVGMIRCEDEVSDRVTMWVRMGTLKTGLASPIPYGCRTDSRTRVSVTGGLGQGALHVTWG
jgi:hypothetical protein